MITRSDISNGYVTVQTSHSTIDWAFNNPATLSKWKAESNSIIVLSAKNQAHLLKLFEELSLVSSDITLFYEPDIDSYTSLCLYADQDIRRKLSHLPLAGK